MINEMNSFGHISNDYFLLAAILIVGMSYSILAKKLTVAAAIIGGILATVIFAAAGYPGIAMMSAFFLLASAASGWKQSFKQEFTNPQDKAARKSFQVVANTGLPVIAGLIIIIIPGLTELMLLAMAAGFASATADTLSSELGTVYGRRFLNIITFQPEKRGLDGVVSLEGILIGILGSCIIASIFSSGFGWNRNFFLIVIAGTAGNLLDSV
ncbi:MAG: DUF92 domain-containing protein, partial [Chitinophagaceae bacterium]